MKFATPKDQFVWFKDFALYINDMYSSDTTSVVRGLF
jgi:hypothetical protein